MHQPDREQLNASTVPHLRYSFQEQTSASTGLGATECINRTSPSIFFQEQMNASTGPGARTKKQYRRYPRDYSRNTRVISCRPPAHFLRTLGNFANFCINRTGSNSMHQPYPTFHYGRADFGGGGREQLNASTDPGANECINRTSPSPAAICHIYRSTSSIPSFRSSDPAFLRQELPLRIGPLPALSRFSGPTFLRPKLPLPIFAAELIFESTRTARSN